MNIDDLKYGDLKNIAAIFNKNEAVSTLNYHLGKKVIVRTFSAGVWFGLLSEKAGNEVILSDARRLYYWKCNKSISLSGVAVHGLRSESKVCPAVEKIWLEAIEILKLSDIAIESIEGQPDVKAS